MTGNDMEVAKAKLVLLGESGVGKSCLIKRFVQNEWTGNEMTTIGASFFTHRLTLPDGRCFHMDLWDTAGQERYKSFAPIYYRGASAALIVYDITSKASLAEAKWWFNQLDRTCDVSTMAIAFVGNKLDLAEQREVQQQDVLDFVAEHDLIHCETSAKTAENVAGLFNRICERVKPTAPADGSALNLASLTTGDGWDSPDEGKRKSKCC